MEMMLEATTLYGNAKAEKINGEVKSSLALIRGANERDGDCVGPWKDDAVVRLSDGSAAVIRAGVLNKWAVPTPGMLRMGYVGPIHPDPPKQIFGCEVIAMGIHL